MSDLNETDVWETGIYQIETSDAVLGGPPDLGQGLGIANVQALQLGNRTLYLKSVIESADPLGQYFNEDRGDARYYTQAQVDQKFTDLDGESDPFNQYFNRSRGDARYQQLSHAQNQRLPVGSILPFAGSPAPSGFFICDGSVFSASLTELAAILGSNTLPDLRGQFLRGLDLTGTIDPDGTTRALLDSQADENKAHFHVDGFAGINDNGSFGVSTVATSGNINEQLGVSINYHANTSSTGGAETRPTNVAVNYIIRHDYA